MYMAQPHANEHPDPICPIPCAREEILRTMQDQQRILEQRLSRTEEMIETLMRKQGMEPPPKPLGSTTPKLIPAHA